MVLASDCVTLSNAQLFCQLRASSAVTVTAPNSLNTGWSRYFAIRASKASSAGPAISVGMRKPEYPDAAAHPAQHLQPWPVVDRRPEGGGVSPVVSKLLPASAVELVLLLLLKMRQRTFRPGRSTFVLFRSSDQALMTSMRSTKFGKWSGGIFSSPRDCASWMARRHTQATITKGRICRATLSQPRKDLVHEIKVELA